MALISSSNFLSHPSQSPLQQQESLRRKNCFNVISCKSNELDYNPQNTRRRELLLHGLSAVCTLPAFSSVALAAQTDIKEEFRVYTDEANKFKISIPQDWQVGIGDTDGVRSIIAFYPSETSNSNVSLVISGLGADFTKLESFGKVDAFAETLVKRIKILMF